MNLDAGKVLLLIALVLLGYFLWRHFAKSTAISHDSTVLFTGGIGGGKSMNSVKVAIKAYRRYVFQWRIDCLKVKIRNWIRKDNQVLYPEKPAFKSNIPVLLAIRPWKPAGQRLVYSQVLTRDDLLLKTRIPVHSVVLLDELPQFINQFQWEDAKGELNEFMTFFRHYVNGLFVCNAQSLDEVECHLRRKLGAYYYCFDFSPYFGLFYRCHILRCRVGDASVSLTNEYIDENSKWHYGLLAFKPYDSRCFRHRYDKVKKVHEERFESLTTNKILRIDHTSYKSPLDEEDSK